MHLSEIRINLCGHAPASFPQAVNDSSQPLSPQDSHHGESRTGQVNGTSRGGRLRAFCSLTFDNTFVVRDVKLIEGNDGLFLAMPSRKVCDRCRRCGEKNHLRARFCNQCGIRLDENRSAARNGLGRSAPRTKLHADIAHPINAECRIELERRVLMAYLAESERSKLPGYVPPNLDGEYGDYEPESAAVHLRPTGTDAH